MLAENLSIAHLRRVEGPNGKAQALGELDGQVKIVSDAQTGEILGVHMVGPEVTEMKVMLYAYWPPGLYWFDNVTIEPVADATALPSEDSP